MVCERWGRFAEREEIEGARAFRVWEVTVWKFAREGWFSPEPGVSGVGDLEGDLRRLAGAARHEVRCVGCGQGFLLWWDGVRGGWEPE